MNSTLDVFGKTTKIFSNSTDNSLAISTADIIFLRKDGYTNEENTPLTSPYIILNLKTLSTTVYKSWTQLIDPLTAQSNVTKVTTHSNFSSDYAGWNALNLQKTNDWATSGAQTNYWLQVQLPTAVAIHAFVVMGRCVTPAVGEGPLAWRVDASNNGSTWTKLYETGNNPMNKNKAILIENLNVNRVKYSYYRMFALTSISTSVFPGLNYFNLFEYIERST